MQSNCRNNQKIEQEIRITVRDSLHGSSKRYLKIIYYEYVQIYFRVFNSLYINRIRLKEHEVTWVKSW